MTSVQSNNEKESYFSVSVFLKEILPTNSYTKFTCFECDKSPLSLISESFYPEEAAVSFTIKKIEGFFFVCFTARCIVLPSSEEDGFVTFFNKQITCKGTDELEDFTKEIAARASIGLLFQ